MYFKQHGCVSHIFQLQLYHLNRDPFFVNLGYSARVLVKKTQEPGIKLQKADFFRNDTWTSPQTNAEESPKIPPFAFFNSRWPPPCDSIFDKTGVYHNSSFLKLEKIFRCVYLCFKTHRVHPDDLK